MDRMTQLADDVRSVEDLVIFISELATYARASTGGGRRKYIHRSLFGRLVGCDRRLVQAAGHYRTWVPSPSENTLADVRTNVAGRPVLRLKTSARTASADRVKADRGAAYRRRPPE